MNTVKLIREKLGLSQQQVARLLGVSREMLAHYECETRSLPAPARLKLAQLAAMLHERRQVKAVGKAALKTHPASVERLSTVQELLESEARYAEQKAAQVREELRTMQVMQVQTLEWIQTLETFLSSTESADEKQWLEFQYKLALKKLEGCDEPVQLKLELRLVSLEAIGAFRSDRF